MQAAEQMTVLPSIDTNVPTSAPTVNQAALKAKAESWGWLPTLSLVGAFGLLLVVLAYNGGRDSAAWAIPLRWLGSLVLYAPIAVRLFSSAARRQERVGLIIILGLGLYLVKVLYSPFEFKFSDELQHWRTLSDMLQSGHLFQYNHVLPISPLYPALENATSALISLSDSTIFNAGVFVIGAARLTFAVALYLFYEQISGSAKVAGIASILYMASPHYQFFNSMFAYQSLALPLTALVLFAAARWEHTHGSGNRLGLKLAILLSLTAVVATHHLTSYALVTFLVLWSVVALYMRRNRREIMNPAWIALLGGVMSLAWIVYVATITINYLVQPLQQAVSQVIGQITGAISTAEVFRAPDGPLWEQLISLTAIGLIVLGLPVGIHYIWRRNRNNPLALTLAISSFAYYGSLAIRLSTRGAELTGRLWSFLFIAMAFVLAVGVVEVGKSRHHAWVSGLVLPALAVVLFLGGTTSGWPPYWGRLPGPYLVAAFERSIEPQGVAAAEWAGVALGPDHRIAADVTNYTLMGTYGDQDPVRGLSWVFFSPTLGTEEGADIQRYQVRYIVVDKRLSSQLPMIGYYFEPQEPNAYRHTRPVDAALLAKFDELTAASRIFDSGDILIYDLGVVSRVP